MGGFTPQVKFHLIQVPFIPATQYWSSTVKIFLIKMTRRSSLWAIEQVKQNQDTVTCDFTVEITYLFPMRHQLTCNSDDMPSR